MISLSKIVLLFSLSLVAFINISGQNVEIILQTGHYGGITAVCYSPDGKFIATGSTDKTIKLWSTDEGKEIRSFAGSNAACEQIGFNKQSTSIFSVNEDGKLLIWDISTGKIIRQLELTKDKITSAAFHPNGLNIATGSKKTHIHIWDISTNQIISTLKAIPVDLISQKEFDYAETGTLSYSSDGQFLVSGTGNKTAILWDTKTGNEINKFKNSRQTCTSCVSEALISPDNKYIILATSDSIKVFDRITKELLIEHPNPTFSYNSLAVSSDSKHIAAMEYGKAKVWNLITGKLETEITDENDTRIRCVALSPDGKQIVTGNEKRMTDVWDIKTSKKLLTLKGLLNQVDERLLSHPYMYWAGMINETKLSPDSRYIAVGRTGNNAKLIDFKTGKVLKTLTGHNSMVISLSFSNDGKYLVTAGLDGKAILWNVETRDKIRSFQYEDSALAIFSVDISSDNRLLATADWNGSVVIWNLETGKYIKSLYPHKEASSYQIKFSPNSIYIISAGLDRKLKLIEIDSGEEVRSFTGHTELVNSINFNPSGDQFITSSWDGTIRVWDFLSGIQIRKIYAHLNGVYNAKFDNSGKYIGSGGDDNLVKLWNASTGALIAEFSGHKGGVGAVNITADQKYIVSGSRDGSIRIWDIDDKRELVSMTFVNENDWFIKNPEGYFDASEGAFNTISFVKGTELFAIGQFFNEFYRPGLYNELFSSNKAGFRENMATSIDNFPPPEIEIITPENNTDMNKPIITCMVKITNNGGGIKELKVMQNGKRQQIDDTDLKRVQTKGQYIMKTFDITMVPGNNEVSISAFSNGDIESKQSSVMLTYQGLQKASNCYVLSIGINKYENEELNLNYARPDAESFSNIINEKGKKIFNNIYTYSLFDKDANKPKILATLDEISKIMKKEDVFVFFYAGHGSVVNNFFYFITSENTGLYQEDKLKNAIHVKELQEKFKILPALKQVVFIDACHSGTSVDMLAMRGSIEEKALAQLSRSSGIHVMASSESDQQSAEIKSLGHGVFTHVLLEALQGKADGSPKDNKITIYELKSYIDDQVPEVSYRLIRHKQFPSTFSVGHDFPLVVE